MRWILVSVALKKWCVSFDVQCRLNEQNCRDKSERMGFAFCYGTRSLRGYGMDQLLSALYHGSLAHYT